MTRGNGFKLKNGGFSLDIRKKFCTVRVVSHWNKLTGEFVDAPSPTLKKTSWMGLWATLSTGKHPWNLKNNHV